MTFEEIVKQVEDVAKKLDAKKVKEHIVYEFDIIEEGHGALYFELINGRINVQPFEYYDRDLKIVATADLLTRILSGEEDPVAANEGGRIYVEGNSKDLIVLKDLLAGGSKKASDTKASTTKASAKRTTSNKKTTTKKAAANAKKTEAKVTETAKEAVKEETRTVKAEAEKTVAASAKTAETTAKAASKTVETTTKTAAAKSAATGKKK